MIFIGQEVPTHGSLSTTSVMRALVLKLSKDEPVHFLGYRTYGTKRQLERPNFTYFQIPLPRRGERYFRFLFAPLLILAGFWAIIRGKHRFIFAAFPDDASLLIAYTLSLFSGLRLYPYLMDLYVETGVWAKPLDRWLQKVVFKKASQIIVINEGMQAFYQERYQLRTLCIPHILPVQEFELKSFRNDRSSPFVIGYGGTINSVRTEGLKHLVNVVKKHPNMTISYFTPQSKEHLISLGLWDEKFSLRHIGYVPELIGELAKCDVLYNPVYAGGVDIEQIRASFGSKIVEYLSTGVPILIDSDSSFFTYTFFMKYDAGVLVSHASEEDIEQKLLRLSEDETYYNDRAEASAKLRQYFQPETVLSTFKALV